MGETTGFTAWKWIVKKDGSSVRRVDGIIAGDAEHTVFIHEPRDRRRMKTPKPTDVMALPVPAFTVDANFVGEIPPTDVTFTNLSDNVGEDFLRDLSSKFGVVLNVTIYHDPNSHRHFGLGHTVYKRYVDAKTCVEKLNGTYVNGQKVNVFHDPSRRKCEELFMEAITKRPGVAAKEEVKNGNSSNSTATTTTSMSTTPGITQDDSASSEDRKSASSSTQSSSKWSGRSRDRDKARDGDDDFKRFNVTYERFEPSTAASAMNTNYGYPIQGSSSQSTPCCSSSHSSLSNFHHQENSLAGSALVGGVNRNTGLLDNNNSDKVSEGELSAKIDLDTRIKLLLEGPNSDEFRKQFTDENSSASGSGSESDTDASTAKRARLSLESVSEEESKEASLAKKFKQSFVRVTDSQIPTRASAAAQGSPILSPPPSPFLAFSSNCVSKTVRGEADPEYDLISGGNDGRMRYYKDKMTLVSLFPDADSGAHVEHLQSPRPVQSNYYGEYYNNPYPADYHNMPPWRFHGQPPELQGNWPLPPHPGYDNSYDRGSYYPPELVSQPETPETVKVEQQEDHKNPTPLINALIDNMLDDLKKVLRRDCQRRLIETEAFKMYEDWWEEEEREYERKQQEPNATSLCVPAEPTTESTQLVIVESGAVTEAVTRKTALSLQKSLKWDDEAPALAEAFAPETGGSAISSQDDEYRWAGVEDPKVVITTSRDPSSRLKMFAKEVRLLVPNCQRINRGGYELGQLVEACRSNGVTDLLIVQEHRGEPDGLIVSHLPYGPTAYFTISGTVMRHEVLGIGTCPQQYPHLIFHNFKTTLGHRVESILKYLFPVPKVDSKHVITFANNDDYISVRHHTYKKSESGKDHDLTEQGPRFQLKLYEIKLGTLENAAAADVEWAWRPYMNTARKRRFLSDDDGWQEDNGPQ